MAPRRPFGCLLAALAICGWTACKDKGDAARTKASVADLDHRCEQLAKACGDNEKHVEKIVEQCKQAAQQQVQKGCADKVIAVYDCYEKELCGAADRVWALADLQVLADRKSKCAAEQAAAHACVGP